MADADEHISGSSIQAALEVAKAPEIADSLRKAYASLMAERDGYAAALARIASEHRWAQEDYRNFASEVLKKWQRQ